jgi:hypothetical protein
LCALGGCWKGAPPPGGGGPGGWGGFTPRGPDLGFDDEQRESWRYLIDISGHWPLD